jgi:hypothetical protein
MDHEIISSFHSSFLEEFLEVGGQGEGDFSTGEGGDYPCFPNLKEISHWYALLCMRNKDLRTQFVSKSRKRAMLFFGLAGIFESLKMGGKGFFFGGGGEEQGVGGQEDGDKKLCS